MWEALEVLRRVHRGEAQRSVSRGTGRSRHTVRRYVETAMELGWVPGASEPGEDLAAAVMVRLRPGPRVGGPTGVEELLLGHEAKLRGWLCPGDGTGRGMRLTKALQLLRREGVEVSYPSLRRYAVRRLDFGKGALTVRMADVRPGELAEVDFGKMGPVHDPETGRDRTMYALVVTLVYSRHQYVHLSHSQRIWDFIGGLEDAWAFFGGVPARVVMDNLKPAVKRPRNSFMVFWVCLSETAAIWTHARGCGLAIGSPLARPFSGMSRAAQPANRQGPTNSTALITAASGSFP